MTVSVMICAKNEEATIREVVEGSRIKVWKVAPRYVYVWLKSLLF